MPKFLEIKVIVSFNTRLVLLIYFFAYLVGLLFVYIVVHTYMSSGTCKLSNHAKICNIDIYIKAPFASLKKQAKTLFRLICCEKKHCYD